MSIRPIDIKMVMPKTQEISKIEQNNQDKLKFSLEMQTNEQNQNIDKKLKTVNDSEKLSKSKIKEDEKEKNNNRKNNDRTDEENESTENQKSEEIIANPDVGGKIDIKI